MHEAIALLINLFLFIILLLFMCVKTGETALIVSCKRGDVNAVTALVAHNANVQHVSKDGTTALSAASSYGSFVLVKYLIEECHVKIHTTHKNDRTLIANARNKPIEMYLQQQIRKEIMQNLIHNNVLPFTMDVMMIIISYLDSSGYDLFTKYYELLCRK